MDSSFYFLGCIILLFGAIFLGFKLLELNQKRVENKYKTDIAHFLSDLYRLRVKWSDMGQFGYVESIDNLIKFHGIAPEEVKRDKYIPLTNDIASTEFQLSKQRKEELVDVLRERGIIDTEFKG